MQAAGSFFLLWQHTTGLSARLTASASQLRPAALCSGRSLRSRRCWSSRQHPSWAVCGFLVVSQPLPESSIRPAAVCRQQGAQGQRACKAGGLSQRGSSRRPPYARWQRHRPGQHSIPGLDQFLLFDSASTHCERLHRNSRPVSSMRSSLRCATNWLRQGPWRARTLGAGIHQVCRAAALLSSA